MTRQIGWLVALAAVSASGCAAYTAQRARDQATATEVGGYRYRQPVDAVWPQVRRLLADHGLRLAGKDAEAVGQEVGTLELMISTARETSPTPGDGLTLETAWTHGGLRWRAVAEPAEGGCRVVLTRIEENSTDHGHDGRATRDYAWELELIRRLDPEGAARIDDLIAPPGTARVARPPPEPAAPASPPPTVRIPAIRVE